MKWLSNALRHLSNPGSARTHAPQTNRGRRRRLEMEALEDRCLMSGSPVGTTIEYATAAASGLQGIVAGPGGTLWFTEAGTSRIGELIPGSRPGLANIVEYQAAARSGLYSITLGRDGNFWFTERNANKIGELIPGSRPGLANIVEYALPTNANPGQITVGPDGNLWFTESGLSRIGQLIPGSRPGLANIVEYSVGFTLSSSLLSITAGPGGALWFPAGHTIAELIPGSRPGLANIVQYPLAINHDATFITAGFDGNLWFTEYYANKIGELIPGSQPGRGNIIEYDAIHSNASLGDIAMASDGNVWFTEAGTDRIAELIPGSRPGLANTIEYAAGPTAHLGLANRITMGPDGNMWYLETGANKVGSITTISPTDPLANRYGALGAVTSVLGAPTSLEQHLSAIPGVRAEGMYQSFQGGMIYSSAASGAHEVHGAILAKWQSLGYERSLLGYPTSDESPANGGRDNAFQNGMIYWSPATGAHEVHGAILAEWQRLGAEKSVLGFPTSDESAANGGRDNTFQFGVVYWSAATGAHEIHGAILDKWRSLGAEKSFLGYPTSDESATANGGRYNTFQGGVIYWSPATGAHEVHGAILARWQSLGAERSFLGFAISDEYAVNGGRRSDFQGGYILWTPQGGAQVFRK